MEDIVENHRHLEADKKEFFVLDLMQGNTGTDEIGKYLWAFNIKKNEEEIDNYTLWYLNHLLEGIAKKILDKKSAIEILEELAKDLRGENDE